MAFIDLNAALLGQFAPENSPDFWAGGGKYEGKLGPWSTLGLDDQTFPGVDGVANPGACAVKVMGDVKYRIDDQKARGHDGHRMVVTAYETSKFTAEAYIWRQEQWQALLAYLPYINPKLKENQRKAFTVLHPFLNAYGINQVYINEISLPDEHEGRMVRVVKFLLWEVFDLKPQSKTAIPKQTDSNGFHRAITEGNLGAPGDPQGAVTSEPRGPG